MKFDFIIGNPPYQEEQEGDNKTFAPPIYHSFLESSYQIADKVELIHPARFLFNAGSTPKEFNRRMLNDPHLKVLYYEEDASKMFAGKEIKAGIAITYRDSSKQFGAIKVFTKYAELNTIKDKAAPASEEASLSSIVFTQNRFDLDKLYKKHPELKSQIGSDGRDKRFRNNIFDKIPLFTETKEGKKDIEVIGVVNNKRCWRYISPEYVDQEHENLEYWKVIVPRANGKGILSDVLSSPMVIAPHQAYTQTFIGIGAFEDRRAAENALKYIKTKFARALLCVLKVDQHNEKDTWRMIPLQDFSAKSDINWNCSVRDIDSQLCKKYHLSDSEIAFLEKNVKEMD